MIGRTNTGGGVGGLNFKVVGGTEQPANPKENTIWVDTDAGISGWFFSAIRPVPTEGLVWVRTGDVSPVRFNAVRKNTIMVYAYSVKQYVGGEWVKKSAYIWDREWVLIAGNLTIYDSGISYVPLNLVNAVYKDNGIAITLPKRGNASIYTKDAIDITNYKKVSVTYSGLSSGSSGTSSRIKLQVLDVGGNVAASTVETNESSGTITLDVTSLTGLHKIQVYARNTSGSVDGKCSISKILMTSVVSDGDQGQITFSSFEVDDNGHLWIVGADQTSGAGFALNEESGNLEVTYG